MYASLGCSLLTFAILVQYMCLQCVDVWSRDLGNESKGVSEAVSHREENA